MTSCVTAGAPVEVNVEECLKIDGDCDTFKYGDCVIDENFLIASFQSNRGECQVSTSEFSQIFPITFCFWKQTYLSPNHYRKHAKHIKNVLISFHIMESSVISTAENHILILIAR